MIFPLDFKHLKAVLRRLCAKFLMILGKDDFSYRLYLNSLKHDPNNTRTHRDLSRILAKRGELDQAIARLEVATRTNPDQAELYNELSRLYFLQNNESAAASNAFKSLCINPNLKDPNLFTVLRHRSDGNELLALQHRLRTLVYQSSQRYGRYGFYQGYERLLLPGQRTVENRYKQYGLDRILKPSMQVLDIGSNCGFLSLCVAQHVHRVFGIEVDPQIVEVSNEAAKYLCLENNVCFKVESFEEFYSKSRKLPKFDLIISAAVHMHVSFTIEDYANICSGLLKEHGFILFESQDIRTFDWDFPLKIPRFLGERFIELDRGATLDENGTHRIHILCQMIGH